MTEFLDRVASDLLHVEHGVRTTLRGLSRGAKPERSFGWNRLWLTTWEARTLLRGAMPAPIAGSRMRGPHARLVVAMSLFSGHLVSLNDPWVARRPDAAVAAAIGLMEELRRWTYVARWSSACRAARVRIPVPITPLMRHRTAAGAERLPNAWAGALGAEAAGARSRPLPHQMRALRAEQAELDLAAPVAEVVDLRQMRLDLAPPARGVRHGEAAA